MAALSAGSLTYTVVNKRRLGNSKINNHVKIAIPASQTYITGGVPLTNANMGCPNALESLVLNDVGTAGYVFTFNSTAGTIQMWSVTVAATGAATVLTEVANTVTPGAINLYCDVIGW